MKIEMIKEGSSDCPLIRIYHFSIDEILEFMADINDLIKRKISVLDISNLRGVDAINDLRLSFELYKEDKGLVSIGKNAYKLILTEDSFISMTEKLEGFCRENESERNDAVYQWLDETSEISLLLSPSGFW